MISYRIDIECALNGGATGRHWSDRSRRRAGVDRFQLALGPGTGAQGHRDAGSDFHGERYHTWHRSHLYDARGRASGAPWVL